MYEVSNLSLRVRDKIILKEVNLTLQPGTFAAIVGPNGAGKSSLMVAGTGHRNYKFKVQQYKHVL